MDRQAKANITESRKSKNIQLIKNLCSIFPIFCAVDRKTIFNVINQLFKMETKSEISKKMSKNKEKILETWIQKVRDKIPEARSQDKEAIRNTIPDLLDKMAETLSQEDSCKQTADLERELDIAREHGEQRSHLREYSLDQIVHEYQLLRQVIFEILEKDRPLDVKDRNVILDALSLSERKATFEFHRIRIELERDIENATKEKKKVEKERDLSHQQLRALEDERKLRETFVSTLSHDLMTPITAALMNLQLLIRKKGEEGAFELYTGRIIENLNRLSVMIQDLLDANRIRAGKSLPIKIAEVDLNQTVQTTLDGLTAVYGGRFDFESEGKITGFWDASAIQRMIENLCINAIKYGHSSEKITVAIQKLPEKYIQIKVHNWGSPISEKDQKKLFQQFQRMGSIHALSKKGWGIGLVLVRGMAEAHGGNVRVESEERKGTTFFIQLPVDAHQLQSE